MADTSLDYGIKLSDDFLEGKSHHDYSKYSSFEHDYSAREPLKEQALWQAVIQQAIFDATCRPANSKARREKTRAIMWISPQNKDFLLVCEFAGLDPLHINRLAKDVIKNSAAKYRRKEHMKRLRNSRLQRAENSSKAPDLASKK